MNSIDELLLAEATKVDFKVALEDFVKNNSRVRFQKEATYRVDKPDYAERAVTETVVNALIHRSYVFPGSERRNPILADLFHRMRFIEREGSDKAGSWIVHI